jgi:NAD(P)-dependent dehydrogenase (short-subunit alcohol dehydrogenase family)
VAAIRAEKGVADFLQADLDHADSTRKLARRALEITGHIDILVNSAGIFPRRGASPENGRARPRRDRQR